MPGKRIETRIIDAILADVTDRRGWRQEWNQFDDDVKREIRSTWRQLIVDELRKEKVKP